MDANKLENIISGYCISADDAAWLRALAPPAAAEPDAVADTPVSAVREVRERTGVGYAEARNALLMHGNSVEQAINWLNKLGLASSTPPDALAELDHARSRINELTTQLDHARRRIGELTIQLGEVAKAPPAAGACTHPGQGVPAT